MNFSDKLSLYHGKMFHLSSFVRQAVNLSREFVPLEQFAQTRCLELLIHLNNFVTQPVNILGELVPHKRLSQTNGLYI